MRIVKQFGKFRIVEHADRDADFENLCGDCFDYEKSGYTGTREELAKELEDFRDEVNREGVYGYVLEMWDGAVGKGWTRVDSCWGFVGQYSETEERYKHYIVQELLDTAKDKESA